MSVRATVPIDGAAAVLLALLRAAPLAIEAAGGRGLPSPGSLNEPAQALTRIAGSPDLTVVAVTICATGVVQVMVVLALWERLGHPRRWNQLSVTFGVVSAGFLMIDGALGMTALPQLAQLDPRQAAVQGAYLAALGLRNGIDRVIPLTLGIWALTAHLPALRRRTLARPVVLLGLVLGGTGVAGAVLPAAGTASVFVATLWAGAFAILLLRPASQVQSLGR